MSNVEKVEYAVVEQDGAIEIRDYKPYLVAETVVEGTLETAGGAAFNPLFKYISGENKSQAKIAMTSPVTQAEAGEKIAMTAPVEQRPSGGGWIVSFAMPAEYTLETLPAPNNPKVSIRQVPGQRVACIRYSGTWSQERYSKHLETLQTWMRKKGLITSGEPVWARYNPPFTPWFMRRNEILIPIPSSP